MIGTKGPFPETSSRHEGWDGGPEFIGSSESVGAGHEDSMNRLPDPNAEWTNSAATPERVVSNPNTPHS